MSGATMLSPMVRSGTNVQPRVDGDNLVATYLTNNIRIYTHSSGQTRLESTNWLRVRGGASGMILADVTGANNLLWVYNSALDDYVGTLAVSAGAASYGQFTTNKYKLKISPFTGVTEFIYSSKNSIVQVYDSAGAIAISLSATAGHVSLLKDNASAIFGAGSDASMYYDGTNLLINPKLVGTGYLGVLGNVVIGTGAAGVDYTLTFDGETSDLTVTYMEDESRLDIDQNVALKVDGKALYFGAGYDASIMFDGSHLKIAETVTAAAQIQFDCTGGLYQFGLNEATDSQIAIWDSGNTQYLNLTHNTTNGVVTTTAGELILAAPTTITIGTGAAGVDYILKFNGETNDGTITYMEDEDTFRFSDDIEIPSTDAFYLGNLDTDGSWRIIRNGNNLNFERREASAWVSKGSFTP